MLLFQVKLQGGARPAGGLERPRPRLRQGGVRDQGTGVRPAKHAPYTAQGRSPFYLI